MFLQGFAISFGQHDPIGPQGALPRVLFHPEMTGLGHLAVKGAMRQAELDLAGH